jgi:predicted NUDIX family NTP pyrophosphohydrolase
MIPKGAVEPGEAPVEAALREFEEELGSALSAVPFPLCHVRQAGGKWVEAFAVEGDLDPASINSAEFEMEWPPRSGRKRSFPEAEEARWMSVDEAREWMLPSQLPMLDALEAKLRLG